MVLQGSPKALTWVRFLLLLPISIGCGQEYSLESAQFATGAPECEIHLPTCQFCSGHSNYRILSVSLVRNHLRNVGETPTPCTNLTGL